MSLLTASRAPRTVRWAGLVAGLSAITLLIAPAASAEPPAGADPIVAVAPPTVTGPAQVGATLVATAPTWTPDGVTTDFQWLRDGQPVVGETENAYAVGAADVGRTLAVQATGTSDGLDPVSVLSAATDPVVKIPVSVTVTGSSPLLGQVRLAIQVSATGEPALDGTAWVKRGSTLLRNQLAITDGQATFTTAAPAGTHTYTVFFRGTDRVDSGTGAASVTTKAKAPATVAVTGSSPRVGEVKLSIKVTAPGVAGIGGTAWVKRGSTLLRNSLPIKNGAATFTATKVPSGTHTYTVFYRGSTRVTSDTGTTRVLTKAKARPSITLKPTTSVGKVSIGITVTAPGHSALGGAVRVTEGSTLLRSNLVLRGGKATFTATKVKAGRHTYTVGYKGSSQVNTGSKTITVKVPAPPKPVKLVAYKNCTELNKVHPHGVGRSNAKDKVSGSSKPVTTFLRNTALYELNTGRDRDKDGVACEKH